jgi:hypothetical protein
LPIWFESRLRHHVNNKGCNLLIAALLFYSKIVI